MNDMSSNIILVILVTSLATYLSRFLGVVSSEKIDQSSKIFKWFNCIAYSILASLIARMVIFPSGVMQDSYLWLRLLVFLICIFIYLSSRKNLVYPTIISAILLSSLNSFL